MKSGIVLAAALLASVVTGSAQEARPVGTSGQTQSSATPAMVKIQLTLARYQGEKKVSSLPYTLTVNADERNRNVGRGNLRVGTQVPITTMSRQGSEASAPLVPTVQYRDVGTSIDCIVTALDDGRFRLDLTVEDSSVETTASSGANNMHPAFKSFRTSESLVLRDGGSSQYSTATDKVSGDVWKIDVSLTVVK